MPTLHCSNWILMLFLLTSKNKSHSTGKSADPNMLCVWVILKNRADSKQHQPVRERQPLNKTSVWCVENRHGGLNALNISSQAAMTNPHLIVHWTVPPSGFYAWSRIIPMWQLSSQNSSSLSFKRHRGTFISTAYHLSQAHMTLVCCRQRNIPLVIQFSASVFSIWNPLVSYLL